MTLANQITLARILLIPVFVAFALYYGQSCAAGTSVEAWRWAATGTFLLAAGTDGVDGWVARRFNQRSRLGSILDPIADKGLLLSALVTLTFSPWPEKFPLWFLILVITRDLLAIGGALLLGQLAGLRELTPHWTGKVATVAQMTALGSLMLHFPHSWIQGAVWIAAAFTFASGIVYLIVCLRMLAKVE
ncbi:MAG: CDP-diacylglycerol--glycerol-3-phosphate 3-phosphatidyltransferase [Verrucomicrobiales bacterium]